MTDEQQPRRPPPGSPASWRIVRKSPFAPARCFQKPRPVRPAAEQVRTARAERAEAPGVPRRFIDLVPLVAGPRLLVR